MIAGPFWGEFGWELLRWQGHLRWLKEQVGHMHVICMPGHRYLYQDFADRIDANVNRPAGEKPNMWKPVDDFPSNLLPSKKLCCDPGLKQKFIKYGKKNYSGRYDYDVIIHARNCKREGDKITGDRTYKHWEDLVERLGVNACVGTVDEADCPEGVEHDLRGLPLKTLADVLANTKLLISPCSGLVHFAALCGTPSLVWTDRRKWRVGHIKTTNYNRLKKHWNPFLVPCCVVDDEGWQPSVDRVMRAIEKNELL